MLTFDRQEVGHSILLEELRAVTQKVSNSVRGYPMSSSEADAILILYQGLDPNMRDRLLAHSIEDMLAVTVRCKELSKRDSSWYRGRDGLLQKEAII
jgi:hypothetical protein